MVLAVIGGILGIAQKKAGGILALISGITLIVFTLIYLSMPLIFFWFATLPYSFFAYYLGIGMVFLTIESIIILVGGIVGLASGSD